MNKNLEDRITKLELEVHVLRKLLETYSSLVRIAEDQFRKIEAESNHDSSNSTIPS